MPSASILLRENAQRKDKVRDIMADYIVRAAAAEGQIRAFAVTSREMTEMARINQNSSPVVTAAVGRMLSAAAMMGVMMKGERDLLTLQIQGDGPMRGVTVTADSSGKVKGFANVPGAMLPPNALGKLDVGGAIGHGVLRVIRDMGMKEPYVGSVELQTGEIAEDLTYYFAASEQTPSSVGLGVLMNKNNTVNCAGGFIVQLMPDVTDEIISLLEENLKDLPSVTQMLSSGMTPEDMLRRVLRGLAVTILETRETGYFCDCSRERVTRSLKSLGEKELEDMIADGKTIEVKCQFCDKAYYFTVDELRELLESRDGK